MRYDLVLFLLAACGSSSIGANVDIEDARRLQQAFPQTLNYRANYSADFQYLSDPLCDGPVPTLIVACVGASMTILNMSDESIICSRLGESWIENGTTYECENTCVDTACQEVYLHNDRFDFAIDGPFGSIYFMCEGDTLAETEAYFAFLNGTTNGTCAASTSDAPDKRNYHIGRLGVSCPFGEARRYVYDDTYFECGQIVDTFSEEMTDSPDDVYSCVSGFRCNAEQCSIAFATFFIQAIVPNFFDSCIEQGPSVDITEFPTKAPSIPLLEFTAQYEASWAIIYESEEGLGSLFCSNTENVLVGIVAACGNGAAITFFNSTDLSTSCTKISDSEITCSSIESSLENQFVSVFYECVGPQIPTSTVTFPESSAFCNNNTEGINIQHAVTLGVACTDEYYYGDWVFECADERHDFSTIIDEFGVDGTRLACSEAASFSIGSTRDILQAIASVSVTTDDYWLAGTYYACFEIESIDQPVSPVVPSPGSMSPTLFPTAEPSDQTPTSTKPTNVLAPIETRGITEAPAVPSTNGGGGSPIGAILGGLAGGIALIAVFAFFLLDRRKSSSGGSTPKEEQLVSDVRQAPLTEATTTNEYRSAAPVVSPLTEATTTNEYRSAAPLVSVIPVPSSSLQPVNPVVPRKDHVRVPEDDIVVPIATAVEANASVGGSLRSNKAEPPGRRQDNEYCDDFSC